MVDGLGQGDRVKSSVELAIAAAVEPHPLGLTRTCRDRGDTGQGGGGVGRPKPADVADLADQLGGDEQTGSGQLEQRMTGDARADPSVESPFLDAQPAQVGEPTPGKVGLDAGHVRRE
jgi:hypothetical protein